MRQELPPGNLCADERGQAYLVKVSRGRFTYRPCISRPATLVHAANGQPLPDQGAGSSS